MKQVVLADERAPKLAGAPAARAAALLPRVLAAAREPAAALEPAVRADMQARFGHDFGRVRVHPACPEARELGVQALTVGRAILFAEGSYAPASAAGRGVLAHELAHVLQQGHGTAGSPPDLERDAQARAKRALSWPADPAQALAPLPAPLHPIVQPYTVPGELPCDELVPWMDANSPYAPDWAETQCNYTFSNNLIVTYTETADSVSARVRGHRAVTVTMAAPIDMPQWNPARRPNRDAELAAWRAMIVELTAHEHEHRRIGREWKATLQRNYQDLDVTGTGGDRTDALAEAVAQAQQLKQGWMDAAQEAQSAIDPPSITLNCP